MQHVMGNTHPGRSFQRMGASILAGIITAANLFLFQEICPNEGGLDALNGKERYTYAGANQQAPLNFPSASIEQRLMDYRCRAWIKADDRRHDLNN